MSDNLKKILAERAGLVENRLESLLSKSDEDFSVLLDAMRYSTLGGGKRIRAFLTTEFASLGGANFDSARTYASCVEMIHAASLIHDDLPCMDDDDIRRGRPACHIAYPEETALLAGDALMIYPYEVISTMDGVSDKEKIAVIKELSSASGAYGMIGGQQMDVSGKADTIEKLEKLQGLKTGRMIRAACLLGCISAGAYEGSELYAAAKEYADKVGLTFQIIDDLLDMTGDPKALGKRVGVDAKRDMMTFANAMPYEEALDLAAKYTAEACVAVSKFEGSETLIALAKALLMRNN